MPPPSKPKPSVFGDLDDDNSKDLGAQLREKKEQDRRERQVGSQICITRQFLLTSIKIAAERAKVLAEDATAYDYDGVYDDMKQTAKQQTEKKAADRARRQVREISFFLIQLFLVTHRFTHISPNISITY